MTKKTIWPLITISYLSLFVFGLSDNIRGPLFPEILSSFNVSDSVGSLMFSLSSVAGFIGSHIIRYYLRRYNRRIILQAGCIGLFSSMIGLSLSFNFYLFLFFSITFGLTLGVLALVPNILVSLGASTAKKEQFLSGLHSMYGIASFIAPLFIAGFSLISSNWRFIFALTSLFPFSLFLYTLRQSHKDIHPTPLKTRAEYKSAQSSNFKPQLFLAMMVSFSVAFEIMLSSRIALYMRRVWEFSLEESSMYVMYYFIAMLIGRLFFTGVKLKYSIQKQLSVSLFLCALTLFLGLRIHPFFLTLAGFATAPFYPMAISFISGEFPDDIDSAISYMIATDSLMLAFMHILIGKLSDSYGINSAMYTGFIFVLISFFFLNTYNYFFKSKNLSQI